MPIVSDLLFSFAGLVVGLLFVFSLTLFFHGIKIAVCSGCKKFHKKLTSRENLLVKVPEPIEKDLNQSDHLL